MISTRSPLLDRIVAEMVRLRTKLRRSLVGPLLCLVMPLYLVPAASAVPPAKPDFDKVSQTVIAYFQSQPDHQRGDLISQRDVKAALAQISEIGWDVPSQEKIVNRVLADSSFLIRELSTPDGRKFMRKLSGQPGTYTRLDRLSTISNGQDTIRTLIHDPGGQDLIIYMATTAGGKKLGKMMAGTQGGVDLNKPTGRIYTADQLIEELKKVYDATP
jgi:hypothetical protein